MRTVLFAAATLALSGCVGITINKSRPETADTVAGRAEADQQRQAAQARCGPEGAVSQRNGTDGARAGDWTCERPKR